MTTLYVAEHNITKKKYFGKSDIHHTIENLQKYYHGSGLYWKRHLQKHEDNVTMKILHSSEDTELIKSLALMYSKFWNIVESNGYANLKEETGLDGGFEKGNVTVRDTRTNSRLQVSTEDFLNNDYYVGVTSGYKWTDSQREAHGHKNIWNKGKIWSDEVRKNISIGRRDGKIPEYTEEARKKMGHMKGKKYPTIKCPYCNKEGRAVNMRRYHFDNCKVKI